MKTWTSSSGSRSRSARAPRRRRASWTASESRVAASPRLRGACGMPGPVRRDGAGGLQGGPGCRPRRRVPARCRRPRRARPGTDAGTGAPRGPGPATACSRRAASCPLVARSPPIRPSRRSRRSAARAAASLQRRSSVARLGDPRDDLPVVLADGGLHRLQARPQSRRLRFGGGRVPGPLLGRPARTVRLRGRLPGPCRPRRSRRGGRPPSCRRCPGTCRCRRPAHATGRGRWAVACSAARRPSARRAPATSLSHRARRPAASRTASSRAATASSARSRSRRRASSSRWSGRAAGRRPAGRGGRRGRASGRRARRGRRSPRRCGRSVRPIARCRARCRASAPMWAGSGLLQDPVARARRQAPSADTAAE